MGVLEVVGTGRFRFRGGKELGSGVIGRSLGGKQRGGNAPGNNGGPGIRVGVHSRNLK